MQPPQLTPHTTTLTHTQNNTHRATGRKSSESIELQPLHQATTNKTPKGVLRRMPRVRSDEIHSNDPADDHHDTSISAAATSTGSINTSKEKSPSPIGAGLPLLQRLRLLKEKQVSHFTSTTQGLSAIFSHVRFSISDIYMKGKIYEKHFSHTPQIDSPNEQRN